MATYAVGVGTCQLVFLESEVVQTAYREYENGVRVVSFIKLSNALRKIADGAGEDSRTQKDLDDLHVKVVERYNDLSFWKENHHNGNYYRFKSNQGARLIVKKISYKGKPYVIILAKAYRGDITNYYRIYEILERLYPDFENNGEGYNRY